MSAQRLAGVMIRSYDFKNHPGQQGGNAVCCPRLGLTRVLLLMASDANISSTDPHACRFSDWLYRHNLLTCSKDSYPNVARLLSVEENKLR